MLGVLVVDPQPFFCDSLAASLSEDDRVQVVGTTTDELEAARMASALSPDVVTTEVQLDKGSGISLARRIGDGTKTVILTRGHEGDVILDAVAAGAVGCVSHDLDVPDLVPLLQRAAAGRFAVDERRLHGALKRASSARGRAGVPPQLALLTPREREVLQLLSRGLDNEGIAHQLHLSAHTARTHVGNILRKLEVHTRADAARVALREGQADRDPHVLRIEGPDLSKR